MVSAVPSKVISWACELMNYDEMKSPSTYRHNSVIGKYGPKIEC